MSGTQEKPSTLEDGSALSPKLLSSGLSVLWMLPALLGKDAKTMPME